MTLDYLVSLELILLTLMRARKGPARDHVRTNGRLMISHGRNYAVVRVITRRALTRSTAPRIGGLMLRQLSAAPESQP